MNTRIGCMLERTLSVGVAALALMILPSAAWAAAPCPNESLRLESNLNPFTLLPFSTQLPECRAYELVTPSFENGFPAKAIADADSGVIATSPDGSHLILDSQGGFAGTENGFSRATDYELSRSSTGWQVSSISPPAALYNWKEMWAAAGGANFGRTLWTLRTPSQPITGGDWYLREPDGIFVPIGPLQPPSEESGPPSGGDQYTETAFNFMGADADLSHVFFKVQIGSGPTEGWPGDTTVPGSGDESLYEYVGTHNTRPVLVGVNDEGHLISDCGTSLGSAGQLDNYNAVSANGETVFFTALPECGGNAVAPHVAELYARLGSAQTVAISEPSTVSCEECQTFPGEPEKRSEAAFAGASEDGSHVYFLTAQPLLGADATQNLYLYDFDERPTIRVIEVSASADPTGSQVQGVARVSEDGSHVYFVAKGLLTEGPNGEGREPTEGADNLYVYERDAAYPAGRLAFIATLSPGDSEDWNEGDVRPVQATPDGRFLVFDSRADLTPGDTSAERQVFEYDAVREELVRLSTGQQGYPQGIEHANAHPATIATQINSVDDFVPQAAGRRLAVSADGSTVEFVSTGALAPGAERAEAAGVESVYEYHSAGPVSNGNVYLVSDGVGSAEPVAGSTNGQGIGLDPSGDDIFFETADALVPQDGNTDYDIYDARLDGGFPAPVTPAACEGEAACQGPPVSPPVFSAPGSASPAAAGNLAPAAASTPVKTTTVRKKTAAQLEAEKLAKSLKACRKDKVKKKRVACERSARVKYSTAKAKKAKRADNKRRKTS